jgi:type IV pilus assembly protein PilB
MPPKRIISKQLGDLLIERGIINQENLERVLKIQKERGGLLGDILVALGYTTEENIAQALTVQYGFPYLPLGSYEIEQRVIDVIPENVARQYCLIGIDKIGDTLTIAMANPLNLQAIEDIELMSNCQVQIFVSTTTDIKNSIDRYYRKKEKK